MRVLVTRPAQSGERTAGKLRARGHEPLLMPLTEAFHDSRAAQAAIEATAGAIAVTSAEAIRALNTLGAALRPHLHRPVFAVGKATAEEAAAAGFCDISHSDGDGARLADLIAAERALLGENPLTYLAGSPRAAALESSLEASGIPVSTFECYRMRNIEPSEAELSRHLRDEPVDAILFYSRQNAKLFFELDFVRRNLDRLKPLRLLCLSAAIAAIIPQALHQSVEFAAEPAEESLLQLLNVGKCPILI